MTRLSKQARRRAISPKRRPLSGPKTGPKKDNLEKGYREHANASAQAGCFIPKIK